MAIEKWEYLTEVIRAHIDNPGAREFLKKKWPSFNPTKFAPETMMPRLDVRGKEGWELVHMEPIQGEGNNADIWFSGQASVYSNAYFCVFKRRISE